MIQELIKMYALYDSFYTSAWRGKRKLNQPLIEVIVKDNNFNVFFEEFSKNKKYSDDLLLYIKSKIRETTEPKEKIYYVYKHLDKGNNIIYVGQTENMVARQSRHITNLWYPGKNMEHRLKIKKVKYLKFSNIADMNKYEEYFISKHKPLYNILKKDRELTKENVSEDWKEYDLNRHKKLYNILLEDQEGINL